MGFRSVFFVALIAILFTSFSETVKFTFLDDDLIEVVQERESEEGKELEEESAKLISGKQDMLFDCASHWVSQSLMSPVYNYSEPALSIPTPPPNFG